MFPTATDTNITPVPNQFLARATGGAVFVTATDGSGNSTEFVEFTTLGGVLATGNIATLGTIVGGDIVAFGPISTGSITIDGETINSTGTIGLQTAGGNVGIGTATPGAPLHIQKEGGGSNEIRLKSYGTTGQIRSFHANGTNAAPLPVNSGDILFRILGEGEKGGGTGFSAEITMKAAAGWTSTSSPSDIFFQTTPDGSTSKQTRMFIEDSGDVGIGTSNPSATLDVVGDTELNGHLTVDTSTLVVNASANVVGIGTDILDSTTTLTIDSLVGQNTLRIRGSGMFDTLGIIRFQDDFFDISIANDVDGELRINANDVTVDSDLDVTGTLSKMGGAFKIDHPLDPENKFLMHSFVESPDMMNIYNGIVQLDEQGRATVALPAWFETLNKDFRYQLTPIGAAAPNLHIADGVVDNRFSIAGGKPGLQVSWELTGIRQDVWANAHRIPVEVDKDASERGRYLYPEGLGAPTELGIHFRPGVVDEHARDGGAR